MANDQLVLQLIELLADRGALGVSEAARLLDAPKSSVARGLQVLADRGWIQDQGHSGRPDWALTTKVLVVAARAGLEFGLPALALDEMEKLRARSAENCHLAVPDGTDIVLIERLDSPHAVRVHHPIGGRVPMYATSTGKAMLACLPPDERRERLPPTLQKLTSFTVTSRRQLDQQLEEIRQRGYAFNDGEWLEDVASVAAAIIDADGRPLAAISVSGPASRLTAGVREALAPHVVAAAKQISRNVAGAARSATPPPTDPTSWSARTGSSGTIQLMKPEHRQAFE